MFPGKDTRKPRRRFLKSLETEDLRTAERRALPLIAQWKTDIAEARGSLSDDEWSKRYGVQPVEHWRRMLAKANNPEATKNWTLPEGYEPKDLVWDEIVEEIDAAGLRNYDGTRDLEAYAYRDAILAKPYLEHLDDWLSAPGRRTRTEKAKGMQRADVLRFAEDFKTLDQITRSAVKRWAMKLMAQGDEMSGGRPISVKTMHRILSALRGYWRHIKTIDDTIPEELEPFDRLDIAAASGKSATGQKRSDFKPEDVVKLVHAAEEKEDHQLADLIRLLMYSGCRINEICTLKLEDVHEDHFTIREAKTTAGDRDVPIHREISQLVERLVQESKDGYLVTRLSVDKDGKRANAIGKRLGRLKSELGFGREYDGAHSIRRCVSTMFEDAGVPENVAADILGHEKYTMTYGLYSGGTSLAVKAEALAKVRYPN